MFSYMSAIWEFGRCGNILHMQFTQIWHYYVTSYLSIIAHCGIVSFDSCPLLPHSCCLSAKAVLVVFSLLLSGSAWANVRNSLFIFSRPCIQPSFEMQHDCDASASCSLCTVRNQSTYS